MAHQTLLVTKGHPFEAGPFFAAFDAMNGIDYTHVEHPEAQACFAPEPARPYDAFVLYDMPGIEFAPGGPPRFPAPPPAFVDGFHALLRAGQGFVFLHHAIAGWPGWPEYADILGGRFLYAPTELHGRAWPDSGYRHHVTHKVSPVTPDHPVVAGLQDGFEIEDEVYLCPIFEDRIVPLLRSDHRFEADNFYSAAQAVAGKLYSNEGWSHPPGSNLIAWAHSYHASPIAYIACGDDPIAYANPAFRRLIANAVRWVASPEAHAWARERAYPA